MPISIYLIGQNFCKKQNTKQIFIMALQKKKSRQKTKKARELFFSRPKKKKTIKPLSNITKKILAKNILDTFFEQNSNLTLFETGKHST